MPDPRWLYHVLIGIYVALAVMHLVRGEWPAFRYWAGAGILVWGVLGMRP